MSLSDQLWCPTNVQVTVLQARGLRIKGKNGTNDAYAVMQVGKEKFQTSVAEKSVAPIWKEEASFDMPPAEQGGTERGTLHVHVLHRALVGPDKLLGQAVINLLHLSEDKSRDKTQWFKLLDKAGKPDKDRGEVLVDIQFMRHNMTASMFDISAAGKSRSRLSKFKNKVRGKKKDGLLETASNVVPAFSQVLTDSEGEMNSDGEGAAAKDEKKKNKVKSLFSHKSNLHKSLSQSMSVLPGKNSSLSGSMSSGLNVEPSEGKKKFKFLSHKRSGSSDKKNGLQKLGAEQSNVCINGSHIYCEEPAPRTSRTSSNFSISSSGLGSMDDVPDSSPPSVGSSHSARHNSPWTEEEEEEGTIEESTKEIDEEMFRRQELEKLAEEESRIEEEEERRRVEEKKKREEERRQREDEERKREEELRVEQERLQKEMEEKQAAEMLRVEEERKRREEEERRLKEERRRLEEEEQQRREEEERQKKERQEKERMRLEVQRRREEEEQRKAQEEEERRQEEERRAEEARREEERLLEEQKKKQEELERLRREEEERLRMEMERAEEEQRIEEERKLEEERKRREEEEKKEEMRIEREEKRQREKEERVRKEREEEERLFEEERRQRELEEEQERIRKEEKSRIEMERAEEEERRQRELEEEQERIRKEEKSRIEMERAEEEERGKRELEEEQERIRKEEKSRIEMERAEEEERRKRELEEEQERIRKEEEKMRAAERAEEERRQREEERARKKQEEYKRQKQKEEEEQRRRMEEEEERRRLEEEEERRRLEEEEALEMERLAKEKKRLEEEERIMREEAQRTNKMTFDTEDVTNPFDEDEPEGTARVTSARQRCKLPLERNTCSFSEKDLGVTQQEKRQAPKPPRINSSERQRVSQHEVNVNKPSKDKEIKTASVLPQRAVKKIPPVGTSDSDKNNSKQPEHVPRTGSSRRKPAPQRPVEESLSSTADISHRHVPKSGHAPAVHSLNPFEEDEAIDELADQRTTTMAPSWPPSVQQSVEEDTSSQMKIKSSKAVHAPTPPAKKPHTSSIDRCHDTDVTISDINEDKSPAPVQNTLNKESEQEEAVKKDAPPVPSRRLQPVRPLNPLDQQPVSAVQGEGDNKPTGEIIRGQERKAKVIDSGPYALLTQEELISLVLKQEKQLSEKNKKISELEQYIDNLLVRVIEEAPSVLMSMAALK